MAKQGPVGLGEITVKQDRSIHVRVRPLEWIGRVRWQSVARERCASFSDEIMSFTNCPIPAATSASKAGDTQSNLYWLIQKYDRSFPKNYGYMQCRPHSNQHNHQSSESFCPAPLR